MRVELPLAQGDVVDARDITGVSGGTWSTISDGLTFVSLPAEWSLSPQVSTIYLAFPGDLMTITIDNLPEGGRLWAMAGTELGEGACPPYLEGACLGVTGRTFFAFGRTPPWSVDHDTERVSFAPTGFASRGEGGVHLFVTAADRSGVIDLGVVPFE
ncbi:MAG: hypothetical protein ACI8PZ_001265 [Myxococcota bacterium]